MAVRAYKHFLGHSTRVSRARERLFHNVSVAAPRGGDETSSPRGAIPHPLVAGKHAGTDAAKWALTPRPQVVHHLAKFPTSGVPFRAASDFVGNDVAKGDQSPFGGKNKRIKSSTHLGRHRCV